MVHIRMCLEKGKKVSVVFYFHYHTNRIVDSIYKNENLAFVKKFEVDIFTYVYVLRSPEFKSDL